MNLDGTVPFIRESYNLRLKNELMFAVVHLSDFHLSDKKFEESSSILRKLVEDIRRRVTSLDLNPVYIAITGDLTYKGAPEEYEYVKDFVALIREEIDPADVLVAPGNHDLDRNEMRSLSSDIMEKIAEQRKIGLDRASLALQNREDLRDLMKGMRNYYQTADVITNWTVKPENLYRIKSVPIDNYMINFISLNSAYLFSKKYSYFGFIGKDQLDLAFAEADKASGGKNGLNIALFHHPFEAMPEAAREEAMGLILGQSDLTLTGHVHAARLETEFTAYLDGRVRPTNPPLITSSRCVIDSDEDAQIIPGYYIIGCYGNYETVQRFNVWEVKYNKRTGTWYDDLNQRAYPIEIQLRPSLSDRSSGTDLPAGWVRRKPNLTEKYGPEAILKVSIKGKGVIYLPIYVYFRPDNPLPIEKIERKKTNRAGVNSRYRAPSMSPPFDRRKKELMNLYETLYKHLQYDESLACATDIRWDARSDKLVYEFIQCDSSDVLLSDLEPDIHFMGWKSTSRESLRTDLKTIRGGATNSIGLSCIIECSQEKIIVQRKATLEEEKLSAQDQGSLVHSLGGKYAPSSSGGMKYADEGVFTGMLRELEEELYLSKNDIRGMSLLGVTRSVEWNNRPEFHFLATTDLAEDKIRSKHPRDKFEYLNLMFVKTDDKDTFYNILNDQDTRAARKATFLLYLEYTHPTWFE